MTSKEYYDKYGYQSKPQTPEQQADWDSLSNTSKEDIKQNRPFYQEPGQQEQQITQDWYEKYQAGPEMNIWKGLSEILGIKPGAIKTHFMNLYGDLTKRPDFGEEYGLRAEEMEKGLSSSFAARGLLDSSMMGSAMGAGMSDLMQERAMMEEGAWMNRLGKASGLRGEGYNFAGFLNQQYLQDLGLGAEAIAYLTGERNKENQFNMQRYGINPNPNDPITTMEGFGMGANLAMGGFGAFGGGGFGGGGGGPTNIPQAPPSGQTWENYDWFG